MSDLTDINRPIVSRQTRRHRAANYDPDQPDPNAKVAKDEVVDRLDPHNIWYANYVEWLWRDEPTEEAGA